MSFSEIAHVYDRFNELDAYEAWLDFTLNSLAQQPKQVLDVACGTGWFPQLLAPFVDHITAIDIDEAMLDIARKEQQPGGNIEFQMADMLALDNLPTNFDLVTCYADSLCFLADQQQVAQAISQMYQRLSDGGTLLFDVWTPYQINQVFDGFNYFDSDDTAAIIWDSESEPSRNQVSHYLSVFEQTESSLYKRVDVELTERTYPLETYLSAIKAAGFGDKNIEVLVNFGTSHLHKKRDRQTDRWFFRCVK
ncbi:class I SAM-dependent DNA methyltransferase [Fundicoccus sp. Sow4_D5]|uniref:class I SAM-dependent DNA methyltransferase n=1 Tax=unclassified Fundicoccus TaxID=2761543 RepID=UPI003F93F3C1